LDHQSLLEKPEMREIYRNMVELIRQKSIWSTRDPFFESPGLY
jgi:oligoribonuclease NrnB/cAMP/cGMP phosphodiesterase (DHH superfamily)